MEFGTSAFEGFHCTVLGRTNSKSDRQSIKYMKCPSGTNEVLGEATDVDVDHAYISCENVKIETLVG